MNFSLTEASSRGRDLGIRLYMAVATKEIAEPVSKRHLAGDNIDLFATCLQGVQFTWTSSQCFLRISRAETKNFVDKTPFVFPGWGLVLLAWSGVVGVPSSLSF